MRLEGEAQLDLRDLWSPSRGEQGVAEREPAPPAAGLWAGPSDGGGARVSEPFLGACGQSWCMLALRSAQCCASDGHACRAQVCTHPLQCPAHTCALGPERGQVAQLP